MTEAIYRFGEVEVDAAGREVRRAGERVPLEPKALDVLLLLLAEAGRVVDKRRLLKDVWADVHVTDASLARAITQVRRALGDDIRAPRFVETVPTRGYRFIGRLEDAPAAERGRGADAVPPERAGDAVRGAPAPRHDRRGVRWRWAGVLVLAGLLAAAISSSLVRRSMLAANPPPDLGAMMLAAATHQAVQMTTSRGLDADPALSPDGSQLAYASDASGALEIVVRSRVAAGQARALTSNGGDNVDPTWSPDAQWIAYHSRRFGGVWVVPSGGGPPRQVTTEGSSPGWSPDGRSLVYQTAGEADVLGGAGGSPSTLAIVDVATGAVRSLTQPGSPSGFHGSPVWLPGHDAIVFVSVRVPAADVWQVTPGQAPVRLGGCHATCRPFAFRRGGQTWVGVVRGAKAGELWLAPVGTGGRPDITAARVTRLPRAASITDVTVSLDGSALAYSDAERTSEAWTVPIPPEGIGAARAPVVLLAERRPRYSEFAFSPDGQRLAYTTSRLGDRPEPWVHDLGTNVSQPIATPVAGFVKAWLPDGRRLALIDPAAPFVLQGVDVLTGRIEPLARLESWARAPDGARRVFTLRLAPDGQRLFFTGEEAGRLGVWLAGEELDGRPRLLAHDVSFGTWSSDGRALAVQQFRDWRTSVAILRPGDAAPRTLVADADHAWPNDWSPDDRFIVHAAMRQGRWRLEAVEVATGRIVRLTPDGGPTEYVRWPVWSPAGDRIVYERGYWTGNVWVAELGGT